MSIFDDVSRFLETRLEEFLRSNPHLELQAIEEQLKEQEEDTLRLILEIQKQEKTLQAEILSAAQEIQRWNDRANKAKAANRLDLAQAAQERQAALLRQGNQRWGQMQGCKERIEKAKELYRQIQLRRKEVRAKAAEVQTKTTAKADKTEQSWDTKGWNQSSNYNSFKAADPLEQKFQNWEAEEELDRMKRNIGK
ncbi:MAG: TIGR04376 family protein [Microcoleus sp. PH2017_10_PVI_O_A]|uniref:TIGR04376 family protein n=1 Tax=unclassified Microcoleus TaxID=2642155 RepID=UPI001DD97CEB|nr:MULTISPECIES: TIGR04376 family protein [unclassified Microcoleus]TAE81660.1 MAG: TIGR04376 family protein [Oscillatoriales cyanobacterium]MCC3409858.1 TIGR04376 family protein [Microcoleus sp. PH2017_10_PVI_O_A]MCC3461137.1 TIGR04376 family protein [Microcoleus sp. PH2017_11_PCY_U_A]MCC3479654.1 TIGR04376 family protein [Microcoleus sp. PH2017_12_PCY_D_A]MCC3531864.1 TIGR04376 family protein [Microcoleus sp. PH2017_21_RUC_O_A]